MWLRFLAFPLAILAGLAAVGVLATALVIALAYPNLPSLEALTAYQPKIPLRIYTADGVLMGEFGEERRAWWRSATCQPSSRTRSSPPRTSASISTPGSTTSG
jgi:penicillin-binding protein 1A